MSETQGSTIVRPARAIRIWGLLALGIVLGAVAGNVVVGSPPVHADGGSFCERDECRERRVWYTLFLKKVGACVDTPWQQTGCDVEGENRCRTYDCGDPPPPPPTGGGGGGGDGCDTEEGQNPQVC